jgi:hypothetical protein
MLGVGLCRLPFTSSLDVNDVEIVVSYKKEKTWKRKFSVLWSSMYSKEKLLFAFLFGLAVHKEELVGSGSNWAVFLFLLQCLLVLGSNHLLTVSSFFWLISIYFFSLYVSQIKNLNFNWHFVEKHIIPVFLFAIWYWFNLSRLVCSVMQLHHNLN